MKDIFNLARTNLLYLSMLALVLTSTFALSLTEPRVSVPKVLGIENNKLELSLLPTLHSNSFPILSAQGAIAVDLDSSVVLYEKAADTPLLPASTTKIMTALVVLDHFDLNETIKVQEINVEGQKMKLKKGEEISVRSLLDGLLIYSANDAAEVLANSYPGGREAFIEEMNAYARILHLQNTYFTNPSGLDGEAHRSTARDLIHMSSFALKNPTFAEIIATREKTVTSTDKQISHHLTNINELLGSVDGVLGVKTGWTENARENLVTYVVRDNKKILIAVLGSQDRFGETRELINWIFDNYTWEEVDYSP